MRIFIPQKAKDSIIGGGWSFTSNIIKALKGKVDFVERWQDCDIYFITGPTMAQRDEVYEAKKAGKKVVLRIDNCPRNSRNRNTGVPRLYDFSQVADAIVYQSEWAKSFIMPFVKRDGAVILNGVDTEIFKPEGETILRQGNPQYLYVRSSRDETKRWEKAWYDFMMLFFHNPEAHLWIVGKFSPENLEYNFDLFGGAEKRYKFWGVVEDRRELAKIMRSADVLLCPFSNEANSNVVNEALACETEILWEEDGGGIPEQIKKGVISLEEMGDNYLEVFKKL